MVSQFAMWKKHTKKNMARATEAIEAASLFAAVLEAWAAGVDEVDFVFDLEPRILYVEQKLGITYPAAVAVYAFANNRFVSLRAGGAHTRSREEDGKARERDVLRAKDEDVRKEMLDLALVFMTINASNQTAWNTRKRLLSPLDYERELRICAAILTRHPKSGEAWAHR